MVNLQKYLFPVTIRAYMKLVIVESPSKSKTIEKYLGSDYSVTSSVGHVRDLPKSNKNAIDIDAGFVPNYEVVKGKEKVITELESKSKKADEVLLATDPDREGEAIAWHVAEILKNKKIDTPIKRIAFNEITESAVKEAIKKPRDIDTGLRQAQEARRVLDRLVGYELSGLIWKKVRYGLSAGRVQSPALRILMEREREIRAFKPEKYYTLEGHFEKEAIKFGLICDEEPKELSEVERIIKIGKDSSWKVLDIKKSEVKRAPRPPFTTSTLQQVASTRLGFSPSRTMQIAQKLYEAGHITYMRTDSFSISKDAQAAVLAFINKEYGKEYASPTFYKTKSKSAQEAHEAIRPTNFSSDSSRGNSDDQKKLYKLIWERTVASQMTPAKMIKTKLSANIKGDEKIPNFSTTGRQILFDGWLKADPRARGEEREVPHLEKNDEIKLINIEPEEKETRPPNRYTEAGLIKELEKRGIGRPSTYASIMKTLLDRNYVIKEQRTLIPTDTGDVVSSFLEKHFAKYISDSFTAKMEDELDEIAQGKREYEKMLGKFYFPFHEDVLSKEDVPKLTNLGDAPEEFPCPICKKKMVWKLSRSGKFMSCSNFPECKGSRKEDGSILEQPKEIGEDCPKCKDGKLVERDGKFGKFVSCSNYPKCKFIKESEEEAEKKKTGIACTECKNGEMVEKRGRFGIFYACSNYPDCKHAIKTKPTGEKCEMCGKLMMEGTKTIPERCSDKSCPNHNPHKVNKK